MKRAAFLFSGQLRGFEHCIEPFKSYLFSAFTEYDTFFYLPTVDGKKLYNVWEPTAALLEIDQVHNDISNFQHNICQSEKRSLENNYTPKAHLQHFYLQWYGVKKVFEVFDSFRKVNNLEYDIVFRIRPDIKFFESFIYNPFEGIQTSNKPSSGGIYDRLAYGSYDNMKYYCSFYDSLYKGKYNEFKYSGNSESKLLQHITEGNINWRTQNLNFYHSVNVDGACWI